MSTFRERPGPCHVLEVLADIDEDLGYRLAIVEGNRVISRPFDDVLNLGDPSSVVNSKALGRA